MTTNRYTEHHVEQGTDEWHALRAGRLTSSRAADSQRQIQNGESALRRNLRIKMCVERLVGGRVDPSGWSSKSADRGHDMEPVTLAAYEAETGYMVTPVGFLAMNSVLSGGSPDGFADAGNQRGIVEAKSPLMGTHYGYLKHGIPGDHKIQCTHLLWVSGVPWVDWVSHHPDFPEAMRTKIVRVPWVAEEIAAYEAKALEFLGEVDAEEAIMRAGDWGEAES